MIKLKNILLEIKKEYPLLTPFSLEKEAIRIYGTTSGITNGYLLQDGEGLDMGGADHRMINSAFEKFNYKYPMGFPKEKFIGSGSGYMLAFMKFCGALRTRILSRTGNQIELNLDKIDTTTSTGKQKNAVMDFVNSHNTTVYATSLTMEYDTVDNRKFYSEDIEELYNWL